MSSAPDEQRAVGQGVRVGQMTSASIGGLCEARVRRGPRRRPTTLSRHGFYRQWFLWVVHAVKFVAGCGVLYFTIGILLLIETIKIDYMFKRLIYIGAVVLYSSGMVASLCAMRQMHTTKPHVLLAYSKKLQE